jgi:hypothetical protein
MCRRYRSTVTQRTDVSTRTIPDHGVLRDRREHHVIIDKKRSESYEEWKISEFNDEDVMISLIRKKVACEKNFRLAYDDHPSFSSRPVVWVIKRSIKLPSKAFMHNKLSTSPYPTVSARTG